MRPRYAVNTGIAGETVVLAEVETDAELMATIYAKVEQGLREMYRWPLEVVRLNIVSALGQLNGEIQAGRVDVQAIKEPEGRLIRESSFAIWVYDRAFQSEQAIPLADLMRDLA